MSKKVMKRAATIVCNELVKVAILRKSSFLKSIKASM